jgi:acyl carrier protein
MIPSIFVPLQHLPLTSSGKLDRRALPPVDGDRVAERTPPVAPRTPAERHLAQIWSEVLELAQVGIHDDFFDLGGHSLSAMQVLVRVRDDFIVDLRLDQLLDHRTVASLAELVDQALAAEAGSSDLDELLDHLDALDDEQSALAPVA